MKIDESKIKPGIPQGHRNHALQEQSEQLAISALGFLAADPGRLERFLSLSGLTHAGLRAAAAEPGFFAAILDHIAGDQNLLLACAAALPCDPAQLDQARKILSPEIWE